MRMVYDLTANDNRFLASAPGALRALRSPLLRAGDPGGEMAT
jgi:hypothetical protein